jgi:hypothetical protein
MKVVREGYLKEVGRVSKQAKLEKISWCAQGWKST